MWVDELEEGAIKQALNPANLPFAFRHICLMPDAHQGYGMPIGGVMAARDVIVPNAVGVDIGCSMCAVKTNIEADGLEREQLTRIMSGVRELVPLGFDHHKERQDESLMPQGYNLDELGIIHSIRRKSDLEEASSAYKDIIQVMAFQRDLVRIKTELSPLAVIKG